MKKVANFKSTIDLRAKSRRALNELDLYLDEASPVKVHELKFSHGKRKMSLKKSNSDFLSKRKECSRSMMNGLKWEETELR
jgi:dsDNA-specific endonuclease/ATPase MutS2